MADANGTARLGGLLDQLDRVGRQDDGPDLSPAADPEPWPAFPEADAFHGLAGDVVHRIDPETEADPVAVLATFLCAFGNAAGRNAYRGIGCKRHHANLFVCLVGNTAKGRKGTSLDWVEHLLTRADPVWAQACITSGLSSGEGLIHCVRDRRTRTSEGGEEAVLDEGARDKRALVIEEELAQVLRISAREGNTLSTVLRQAWDGRRLGTMTRQNPIRASDVHVSTVAHVTRDELLETLSQKDKSGGLANRYLWFAVRRSKLLPDGGDLVHLDDLVESVRSRLEFARVPRPMRRTNGARDLWHAAYPRLTADRPGALGLCTARAEAQALRLSVAYTLLDGTDLIDVEHVRAALAVWDYCERSCRWVFGESVGNADSDEILDSLRAAGPLGLSNAEIHALFHRNRTAGQLRKALALLVAAGLAEPRKGDRNGTPGRPSVRWFYKQGSTKETKETKE